MNTKLLYASIALIGLYIGARCLPVQESQAMICSNTPLVLQAPQSPLEPLVRNFDTTQNKEVEQQPVEKAPVVKEVIKWVKVKPKEVLVDKPVVSAIAVSKAIEEFAPTKLQVSKVAQDINLSDIPTIGEDK